MSDEGENSILRGNWERGDDERLVEYIARQFHEAYEGMASVYEWTTQPASRVQWAELPENQRELMIAVVALLLDRQVIEA